jgi:catechol 2,3-dioxygenase-like lactoylglutathione lyase family enzyme
VRGAAGERKRWPAFYRHAAGVIGRYEKTVIDCPDPRALAKFYCQVLGMRVSQDIDGWVVIGSEPGLRELAFQRVTEWVPPRWPDPAHPQQLHLDIRVDDADQAEQELRALGATRAPGKPETGFRSSSTPLGIHSASSSVATAQAEPSSAHAADRVVVRRTKEAPWPRHVAGRKPVNSAQPRTG